MNMMLQDRPQIVEKAHQIADMVTRTLEMSIFKQAERDLRADEKAQRLLQELKAKQAAGEEIDHLLDELEQLDVVRRFTVAQEGLSEVVTHVTKILAAMLSDRLDLVTKQEGQSCGHCSAGVCQGKAGTGPALCGGEGMSSCAG
jgi:cell fate (sporulation/competence/biofilm development) regulator YmcA (YheA/YmcA/DUF963 family)